MQRQLLINGRLVALAAGNTAILKPSEQMPLTALALAEILAEIFPPGGVKRSGYGKDLSMYALEDYTTVRHVMVKL